MRVERRWGGCLRLHLPARKGGRAAGDRPGKNQKCGGGALLRGKAQTTGKSKAGSVGVEPGHHRGKGARTQCFLNCPKERARGFKRKGQKPVTRKAQSGDAVAVEPSPFGIAAGKRTPQKRAGFAFQVQAADGEAQGKTHGGGGIGIGSGGDFMKSVESKALGRKTFIDGGSAETPAAGTIRRAQAGRPALDFGDTAAERGKPIRLSQARPNLDGRNSARGNGLPRVAHG
jgi:hypothetical protein